MYAVLPDELMTAALICARPWRKFRNVPQRSRFNRAFFALWRWRLGKKWDWMKSITIWREYVEHHTDEPVATSKAKGQKLKTPWLAHLRSVCCGECGYNPDTFDDVPLAQATIDYHAFCERSGFATQLGASVSELRSLQQRQTAC